MERKAEVNEGDRVRIIFHNKLPEGITIHWHGVENPIEMDGMPFISQPIVEPGGKNSSRRIPQSVWNFTQPLSRLMLNPTDKGGTSLASKQYGNNRRELIEKTWALFRFGSVAEKAPPLAECPALSLRAPLQ